jgi:hypothetical protein
LAGRVTGTEHCVDGGTGLEGCFSAAEPFDDSSTTSLKVSFLAASASWLLAGVGLLLGVVDPE